RVAALNPRLVEAVEEHVHLGEGPGRTVQLLAEEGDVPHPAGAFGHHLAGADEERAGAAAGVADPLPRLRRKDPGEESRDLWRGVELATLLPRVAREVLDQELVGVAKDILVLEVRGAKVEARVSEVFEEVLEPGVPLLRLPERRLAVEVDRPEDALELRLVRVLELLQGLVDPIPDVGLVPGGVKRVEICALGDDEALALHRPLDADWIAAETP